MIWTFSFIFTTLSVTLLSIFSSLQGHEKFEPYHGKLKLSKFSWKDCGSGSEPIQLKSLTLSPDPLIVPGLVSLAFNVTNAKALMSPVSLSVIVKKKVLIWIKVPCEDGFGSCDYKDACSVVPPTCPESFIEHKIPCKCPVTSGNFVLPLSPVVNITGQGIPKWLETGNYEVKVTLKDRSGTELVCVDIYAKLKGK